MQACEMNLSLKHTPAAVSRIQNFNPSCERSVVGPNRARLSVETVGGDIIPGNLIGWLPNP